MKVSPEGRKVIEQREGSRTHAYQDSVGIWTIGVGHTSMAGPPVVKPGMIISEAEIDTILARDLDRFERAVTSLITVPMKQNQFDAMVSLAFNIGEGKRGFAGSSVVRRMNAGDTQGAADAFLMWNKAGGKVLKGLTTRRQAERNQFLGR